MKRMLINAFEEGESRVAILDESRLEEYFVERPSQVQVLGNIYLGRVTNVERGIQAAFVDVGFGLSGFLHVSDAVYPKDRSDRAGAAGPRRIQDVVKPGRMVLVQVIKEEVGSKGPALTTNLSIPGRYFVLMPYWGKTGLSRKITDDGERERLKKTLAMLKVPDGMGGIVRTAGVDRRMSDFKKDVGYLVRLWKAIDRRAKAEDKPCVVYQESELVLRVLRDVLGPDVDEIVVDSREVYKKALDFLAIVAPRQKKSLRLYEGREPLFHHFRVEEEIKKVFSHRVELASGGSIVVDQTEALVAVDVNSGKYRKGGNVEETALAINTEAADEIARHIRLRDLGGLIVIDFIDMREGRHRRIVEKAFRKALSRDRARSKILRMSEFCLVEMTRRKLKHSLRIAHFDTCPACAGSGFVPSPESACLALMRTIRHGLGLGRVARVEVLAPPALAELLVNGRRADLAALEARHGKTVLVRTDPSAAPGRGTVRFCDEKGEAVSDSI